MRRSHCVALVSVRPPAEHKARPVAINPLRMPQTHRPPVVSVASQRRTRPQSGHLTCHQGRPVSREGALVARFRGRIREEQHITGAPSETTDKHSTRPPPTIPTASSNTTRAHPAENSPGPQLHKPPSWREYPQDSAKGYPFLLFSNSFKVWI